MLLVNLMPTGQASQKNKAGQDNGAPAVALEQSLAGPGAIRSLSEWLASGIRYPTREVTGVG